MKKITIIGLITILLCLLTSCIDLQIPVETVIVEKEITVPAETIVVEKEVYLPSETIVVEKEVPVPIEVYVDKIVEVEKKAVETKIVEKEVIKEVQLLAETIMVEKPVYIVNTIEKLVGRKILYADDDNYLNIIRTEGSEIPYLAVYNASSNIGPGCSNSYVVDCASDGFNVNVSPVAHNKWKGQELACHLYNNLSCFTRSDNLRYKDFVTDCTTRTAPGTFNHNFISMEYFKNNAKGLGWGEQNVGVYILTNAKVEIIHKSALCQYGSQPLYQIIISYDHAYTPLELLESIN